MPKMKTRKSAAKRFKVTGSGKFMVRGAKMKHLLGHKSSSKKARLSGEILIGKTEEHLVRAMLPYA
jgi:large subunit ribosomal protein L35